MITFRFIIIRTNQLIPNSTMFYCSGGKWGLDKAGWKQQEL